MESSQSNHDTLTEALRAAYRARSETPVEADQLWRVRVMNHIRCLEPPDAQENAAAFFNERLWRFTPVVCLLIVMLSVTLAVTDFSVGYEVTQFFMNDPVEFTVAQLWG